MGTAQIGEALRRARKLFDRRPGAAVHEDSPANACWRGGLRFETSHPDGQTVVSDMPIEFGGSGREITPGWFARAGTAACTATCIAMTAAARGVELTSLEVLASSRSDARGTLGMADADGRPFDAAPFDLQIRVLIGAKNASRQALEELVETGYRCSPIALCVSRANHVSVRVVEA